MGTGSGTKNRIAARSGGIRSGLGVLAVLSGLLYLVVPVQVGIASGPSMEPGLRSGQVFLMERPGVFRSGIERGDVVVFCRDGATYVKRVLAVAGDQLYILRRLSADLEWAGDELIP